MSLVGRKGDTLADGRRITSGYNYVLLGSSKTVGLYNPGTEPIPISTWDELLIAMDNSLPMSKYNQVYYLTNDIDGSSYDYTTNNNYTAFRVNNRVLDGNGYAIKNVTARSLLSIYGEGSDNPFSENTFYGCVKNLRIENCEFRYNVFRDLNGFSLLENVYIDSSVKITNTHQLFYDIHGFDKDYVVIRNLESFHTITTTIYNSYNNLCIASAGGPNMIITDVKVQPTHTDVRASAEDIEKIRNSMSLFNRNSMWNGYTNDEPPLPLSAEADPNTVYFNNVIFTALGYNATKLFVEGESYYNEPLPFGDPNLTISLNSWTEGGIPVARQGDTLDDGTTLTQVYNGVIVGGKPIAINDNSGEKGVVVGEGALINSIGISTLDELLAAASIKTNENYHLLNDIDCSSVVRDDNTSSLIYNLHINLNGNGFAIKNLKTGIGRVFVDEVYGRLENIRFEHCDLQQIGFGIYGVIKDIYISDTVYIRSYDNSLFSNVHSYGKVINITSNHKVRTYDGYDANIHFIERISEGASIVNVKLNITTTNYPNTVYIGLFKYYHTSYIHPDRYYEGMFYLDNITLAVNGVSHNKIISINNSYGDDDKIFIGRTTDELPIGDPKWLEGESI